MSRKVYDFGKCPPLASHCSANMTAARIDPYNAAIPLAQARLRRWAAAIIMAAPTERVSAAMEISSYGGLRPAPSTRAPRACAGPAFFAQIGARLASGRAEGGRAARS
jgi:hypothetical protein